MTSIRAALLALCAAGLGTGAEAATMTYWNVFNIEAETQQPAGIVTYETLADMMADTNRKQTVLAQGNRPFGNNIVDSASDGKTFWNLFNIEGETQQPAGFVTYDTLTDMMADTNRKQTVLAQGNRPFGNNIVGTGSDGKTYWNLFNIEGETQQPAGFVTYDTLADMMADTNRKQTVLAQGNRPFGNNIVGTGSDGKTYWNVFNIEGETQQPAGFVTYDTLADMMADTNRRQTVLAQGNRPFGNNIVGSGAIILAGGDPPPPPPIPLPAAGTLLLAGLAGLAALKSAGGRVG